MNARRPRRALALAGAAALLLAACAEETGGGDATGSDQAAPEAAAPAEVEVSNDWALAYTGGTAGPADPALEPMHIGYINQEGGVPSFPEATAYVTPSVIERRTASSIAVEAPPPSDMLATAGAPAG